jgi:hypothetical protein
MSASSHFSPGLIISRWLSCTVLIVSTYNPLGRSYYHWISEAPDELLLKVLIGLSLLFIYVFLGWVILGSVGLLGVVLILVVWGLLAHQLLVFTAATDPLLREMIILLCLTSTLAAGLVWPHFVVRLNGQLEKRYLTGKDKTAGTGV